MQDSTPNKTKSDKAAPRVALYVTCLVNTLRPQIGFACVQLIERMGFRVEVPATQTCCGQPGYNGGLRQQAMAIARQQIALLEPFDHVVVPSGSCAGMMINHYPELLKQDLSWLQRSQALAGKTLELAQFLDQHHWQPDSPPPQHHRRTWAHHTSCSCRRETRSHQCAESMLQLAGYELAELQDQAVCCGFGGSFAAKFDALSSRMGRNKLNQVADCKATGVVSADLGCLLHLESLTGMTGLSGLAEKGSQDFLHVAELLAACQEPQQSSSDVPTS